MGNSSPSDDLFAIYNDFQGAHTKSIKQGDEAGLNTPLSPITDTDTKRRSVLSTFRNTLSLFYSLDSNGKKQSVSKSRSESVKMEQINSFLFENGLSQHSP